MVRYLARQGVTDVILSTGYRAETVAAHFTREPLPGVTVQCVPEPQPLGTAGGFLNAIRAHAGTPAGWLVLNGDSLVFADLAALARQLEEEAAAAVVLGREVPDAARFGTLLIGPDQRLLGFQEKQPGRGRGVISAGVYLLRPTLLAEFPARTPLSFETDVFPALTARAVSVKVRVVDAPFLDIGTPETLPQAEAFIQQNRAHFI